MHFDLGSRGAQNSVRKLSDELLYLRLQKVIILAPFFQVGFATAPNGRLPPVPIPKDWQN